MFLAWQLYRENGACCGEYSSPIKQGYSYEVTQEAFQVHGLERDYCEEHGEHISDVAPTLSARLYHSDLVICHNTEFDFRMLRHDSDRHSLGRNFDDDCPKEKRLCTMTDSRILEFAGKKGSRISLQNLHHKLFGCLYENPHHALSDVKATAKCYFELKKRGII